MFGLASWQVQDADLTNDIELLGGKRLLIVEDDYLIAMETRRELEKHGAVIVGPVPSVGQALEALEDMPVDAAILDINLKGETVYLLADVLEAQYTLRVRIWL